MAGSKKKPTTPDGRPMLKMKELVEATRVTKATVLLYVKEGLLPKPVKTSPNMAYYDPVCIERISFIKSIQASHRLSLTAIRALIDEMKEGGDIAPSIELQSLLFGNNSKVLSKIDFITETGLKESQVDELIDLRVLIPLSPNRFDAHDVALGRLLYTALAQGFLAEELAFYPKLSERIVDEEMQLSKKHTKGISFENDAGTILELTRLARGIRAYIVDRLMQKKLIKYKDIEERKKN